MQREQASILWCLWIGIIAISIGQMVLLGAPGEGRFAMPMDYTGWTLCFWGVFFLVLGLWRLARLILGFGRGGDADPKP